MGNIVHDSSALLNLNDAKTLRRLDPTVQEKNARNNDDVGGRLRRFEGFEQDLNKLGAKNRG